MKRGLFITFEGSEGVGKSTNIQTAAQYLAGRGIDCLVTREPGGTPLAEEIRNMLLSQRDESMHAMTELLLMFAARAQHLHSVILPAMRAGQWVLCDRFTDATYAYQGGGREMAFDRIGSLEIFVQGQFRPDHVILLDAPVAVGLERAGKRGEADRFEAETVAFFERVRETYIARSKSNRDRYVVMDATQSLERLTPQIRDQMGQWVDHWEALDSLP